MRQFNIKDIISVIIIIVLFFYIYINKNNNDESTTTIERDNLINQLEQQNNLYMNDIAKQEQYILIITRKIDSLESLKPKIVEKYKYINYEIDKSNCSQLITKFDSIFSSSGIK
jgi:hypothetical protein